MAPHPILWETRMPFKSEAQRRKFAEMVKQKKISQSVFDEWNDATPKKIPEKIGKKPKMKTVKDLEAYRKKRWGTK